MMSRPFAKTDLLNPSARPSLSGPIVMCSGGDGGSRCPVLAFNFPIRNHDRGAGGLGGNVEQVSRLVAS